MSSYTQFMPFLWLKDPYIIHEHPLGKDRGIVRRAGPITPHCHIEDEKERTVKRIGSAGDIGQAAAHIDLVVHQELSAVIGPDQAKYMELLGKILARKIIDIIIRSLCAILLLPFQQPHHLPGLRTYHFHDV